MFHANWRQALFVLAGYCCMCSSGVAYGAPRGTPAPPEAPLPGLAAPARVEVGLISASERDPVLFARVRSLFPPQTAVVLRAGDRLDREALLQPERADTLYLWIRVSAGGMARVYMALREADGAARYLTREIKLEAGLDEVGSETLAQIAHSSAQALWRREQQTPPQELLAALKHDEAPPPPLPPTPSLTPSPPPASRPAPRVSLSSYQVQPREPDARRIRFGLGAGYSAHASGTEGWFHQPGAFLSFEYIERLSLRLMGSYLLPTEFDVLPARLRLRGASGEFRAGWLLQGPGRSRVRLEGGLGVLLARTESAIAVAEPKAQASSPQNFERYYALAGASLLWPIDAVWLGAGAELRAPFKKISYEVSGQSGASVSPAVSPGATLEIGILLDPAPR